MFFFVEHEGSNSPSSISTSSGLATDTDSGTASAVLILSARDGTSGHRHDRTSSGSNGSGDNRSG